MKRFFYISVFTILCVNLMAQTGSDFLFKGQVISKDTKESVPYASIYLISKNKGTASSPQGNFDFRASTGDTIRISSVGYADYTFVITKEMSSTTNIFELAPKALDLDDVKVIQLSDNFYLRKKRWDTLKLDLPANIMSMPIVGTPSGYVPQPDDYQTITFAAMPIFQEISRNPKQARIIRKMEAALAFDSQRKTEREKYFNKALVKKVTRIDDRVIDEFMVFCAFLDGEIIGKTEYQIAQKILDRYQAFLKR